MMRYIKRFLKNSYLFCHYKTYFLLLSIVLFAVSCERVIDLPESATDKKVVIEGVITNHVKECVVYVTTTSALNDTSGVLGVSGANVSIQVGNSMPVRLLEVNSGHYANDTLLAPLGSTCKLTVEVGGKVYTAISTMPSRQVFLDSMTIEYSGLSRSYVPFVFYLDPADMENNYLFTVLKNSKKYNAFFNVNDEYTNGKKVKQSLITISKNEADKVALGDTVLVNMYNISKEVYKYWYSFNAGAKGGAGGPGSTGSPANPVTNIQGGALGYFSAQTLQKLSKIME